MTSFASYRRPASATFALTLALTACPAAAQSPLPPSATSTIAAENTAATVLLPNPFQEWLNRFRTLAATRGITPATLEGALTDLQPIDKVLEYDRRQPEFIDTFWNYLNTRVNANRLAVGKEMLAWQQSQLTDLEQRYGVPARYLVALWGMETNYGSYLGGTPIIAALATLAFEGRRADFFRDELLAALRIVDEGHATPATLLGSWAGAMGQMQFIPSTFLRHAIDADGDGRKDLWNSLPDALHSAANYLNKAGWRSDEPWGREVRLPAGFDLIQANLSNKKTLREWSSLGVLAADGSALPDCEQRGAIILPQGHQGPAFLVQRNFEVILGWNRSINYALAVGHLADRLIGLPPLQTGLEADNRRIGREQMIALQQALELLGYDPGLPDGVLGTRTRAAIRNYQTEAGLPADGHPSISLLEHLQAAAQSADGSHDPANAPPPAAGITGKNTP